MGRDSTGFDCFQELFDVLPRGIRDPAPLIIRTSSSTRGLPVQWLHARHCSSVRHQLFNSILMIGEGGDLRQMRHAEDLIS